MRDGRVWEREGRDLLRVCSDVCGRRGEVGCVKRGNTDRVDSDVDVDVKLRVLCRCRRVERKLILLLKLAVREGIESKMHLTMRPQRRHILARRFGSSC